MNRHIHHEKVQEKGPKYTLWSFLFSFLLKQPITFFCLLLLVSVWPIDMIVFPSIVSSVVDVLTHYESNREAVWVGLMYPVILGALLWISTDIGYRVQGFLLARAVPQFEADIRMSMFDHVQRHSPRYFQEHLAGGLSNSISEMTLQSSQILQLSLTLFFPSLIAASIALFLFARIQPFFAGILFIWLVAHATICFVYSKRINRYEEMHGEIRTSLVGRIVDSLTNYFAVGSFSRYDEETTMLNKQQNAETRIHEETKWQIEWMRCGLGLANSLGPGLLLVSQMFASWQQGAITTGQAVQIFSTSWNMVMIAWIAGTSLPMLFQSMGLAREALKRMNDHQDVLDLANSKPLHVTRGEICFENVSFGYGDNLLFREKNVVIHPGEKVGLVGRSGAGKSTFIRLLMRFYHIQEGRILIDGQDINHVTLNSLRASIALIPQDPILFHRTLFENIHYGRPTASKEEVYLAARKAHCEGFIENMSQGYQSLVGERGTKLSGGERQRVAIARAILADSPILLLDEATSALDSITEKEIQESLELLMRGRTTLVIAHRLSTLAKMDRILVFEKGELVESGTPQELLALDGNYKALWLMQSDGFLPDEE